MSLFLKAGNRAWNVAIDVRDVSDAGKPDAEDATADRLCSDAAATKEAENAAVDTTKAAEDGNKVVADGEKQAPAGVDARPEHSEEDELSLGDSDEEEDAVAADADTAVPRSEEKQPEEKKVDSPEPAVRSLQPFSEQLWRVKCRNRSVTLRDHQVYVVSQRLRLLVHISLWPRVRTVMPDSQAKCPTVFEG